MSPTLREAKPTTDRLRVLAEVEDRGDNQTIAVDTKEKPVLKTPDEQSAEVASKNRRGFGKLGDLGESGLNSAIKSVTHSRQPLLVIDPS